MNSWWRDIFGTNDVAETIKGECDRNSIEGIVSGYLFRLLAVIVSCLVVSSVWVAARQSRPTPPGIRDPKSETRERQDREATLRSAEMGVSVAKIDQQRLEASIKEIKEDFRRIQIVRNEIARSVLAEKPFDYKAIYGETAEVNKRAVRLRTYLIRHVPDEQARDRDQKELKNEEMKSALARLCGLIDSFVENPILKNLGVVDVQQATRAGSDLIGIIELSAMLKRSAAKLSKTGE